MPTSTLGPVRLAIVNDYEIVVAGVAGILATERIHVVEWGAGLPVLTDVDIVLYDTFGQVQGDGIDLEDLVRDSGAKVVVFSWNLQPDLIDRAIANGAAGYLSKALTGEEIVDALERVRNGEVVILIGEGETSVGADGDWPGRAAGLSAREAEIIALITQGLSNREIADRAFLSINSVKTYVRMAYRKIGVTRRTQAVLWGIQQGFEPHTMRGVDPNLRLRPAPGPRSGDLGPPPE
jgi:NarL family two-component system response regulator LiaR